MPQKLKNGANIQMLPPDDSIARGAQPLECGADVDLHVERSLARVAGLEARLERISRSASMTDEHVVNQGQIPVE